MNPSSFLASNDYPYSRVAKARWLRSQPDDHCRNMFHSVPRSTSNNIKMIVWIQFLRTTGRRWEKRLEILSKICGTFHNESAKTRRATRNLRDAILGHISIFSQPSQLLWDENKIEIKSILCSMFPTFPCLSAESYQQQRLVLATLPSFLSSYPLYHDVIQGLKHYCEGLHRGDSTRFKGSVWRHRDLKPWRAASWDRSPACVLHIHSATKDLHCLHVWPGRILFTPVCKHISPQHPELIRISWSVSIFDEPHGYGVLDFPRTCSLVLRRSCRHSWSAASISDFIHRLYNCKHWLG